MMKHTYSVSNATPLLHRLALRYGVFLILMLMSVGMLYFVGKFELNIKTSIHLCRDPHDGN